jgi:hypothetical protein
LNPIKTVYVNKDGTLIVVDVFSWNTEVTLTRIRSGTQEVLRHFPNVVGVTREGDRLQFTAVDPFSGERAEHRLELVPNSRHMIMLPNK